MLHTLFHRILTSNLDGPVLLTTNSARETWINFPLLAEGLCRTSKTFEQKHSRTLHHGLHQRWSSEALFKLSA